MRGSRHAGRHILSRAVSFPATAGFFLDIYVNRNQVDAVVGSQTFGGWLRRPPAGQQGQNRDLCGVPAPASAMRPEV